MDGIPEDVREFIFEYIDSIEQLDILMLLRSTRERGWTAQQVSDQLRTNPESAANRLAILKSIGILDFNDASIPSYRYNPPQDMDLIVSKLVEVYKIRRHKVYELIFSSLKRARKFLNAFTMGDKKEDGDV